MEDETYSLATDLETAWDVPNIILGGVGFPDYRYLDDMFSNGCVLPLTEQESDSSTRSSATAQPIQGNVSAKEQRITTSVT